jgi:hypothetical protein
LKRLERGPSGWPSISWRREGNSSASAYVEAWGELRTKENTEQNRNMSALIILPMFAAAGYSLIYLLGGGGLFGAFVIFIVAKMLGR